MARPLLIDLSHTSHTRARTGVQRVCRALTAALGDAAVPITHDPYARGWRPLRAWEHANLRPAGSAAPKRSARWPLAARLRGRLRRAFGGADALPENTGLVAPEIFSPVVSAAYPGLFERVSGPRVALFHDAIALKLPEFSPAKTAARFPSYLRELLAFDGIAAVSEDSRATLLDYWRWAGHGATPPVVAIPLAVDLPLRPSTIAAPPRVPVVLCVGSLEGRKNHLALFAACEALWQRGLTFELQVIGLAQSETGKAARERARALHAAGRPLRYEGAVDDAALADAYARCAFTVYPSLMEGFGLPVLESLLAGKPCVCAATGALGESARDGGCLTVAQPTATQLAEAMAELLCNPAKLNALAHVASARRFRSWSDYVADLTAWMAELRPNR